MLHDRHANQLMTASPISEERLVLTFRDLQPWVRSREELLADKHQATYEVLIAMGSLYFAVHFADGDAAEWMRRRFHDMLGNAEAQVPNPIHVYALQSTNGARFWTESGSAWFYDHAVLTAHVIAFFAECVMTLRYFEVTAAIGLHAAAVGARDRVCAVVGHSTAGKTTTAVACAALGMQLYSDERCVLAQGVLTSFRRSITLRPAGRRLLRHDVDLVPLPLNALLERMANHDDEVVLPPSLLSAVPSTSDARLVSLIVLSGYAEQPVLEKTDVYAVLPALLQSITCRDSGLDRIARVMHEMQGVAVYRMLLGQPGASALQIKRLVEDGDE